MDHSYAQFFGGWRGKQSVIMSNVKVETKLDNERYILNHLFAVGKCMLQFNPPGDIMSRSRFSFVYTNQNWVSKATMYSYQFFVSDV